MGGCVSKKGENSSGTKDGAPQQQAKSPKASKLIELTDDEIALLEANTKLSRQEIIELHRNFLKECPNGKLNKKDFLKLFNEMHPLDTTTATSATTSPNKKQQKANKFCDYVFNTIDSKKSGYITFKDFIICFCIISFGDFKDKCEFAFKLFDLDKDGKISKSEMTKVLGALYELNGIQAKGNQAPSKRVDEIMKKLNQDKKEQKYLAKETFIEACSNDDTIKQYFIDAIFNTETPTITQTTAAPIDSTIEQQLNNQVDNTQLEQPQPQVEVEVITDNTDANNLTSSSINNILTDLALNTQTNDFIDELNRQVSSSLKEEIHEFKESHMTTQEIKSESTVITSSEKVTLTSASTTTSSSS